MNKITELFRYRALLQNLVASEIKLRYRRSVLGFLWTLLNPLLMMGVITAVFSTVMRFNVKDYAVLLFAGLLPWGFFSQSVNNSLMSIVGKGSLLRKVYIPKSIIPLSAVIATLVNFMLSFIPLFCLIAFLGRPMTLALLFIPVAIVCLTLFACGLALLFACLNVFFRDFGHMTEVLLQAFFYASPIIYTIDMVPERYRSAFLYNPMYYLIECFRAPLFYGTIPSWHTIVVAGLVSVASCLVGFTVFWRFESKFVFRV